MEVDEKALHSQDVLCTAVRHTSIKNKYMLTIKEASNYFSIGEKKLRRLAEEHTGDFAVINGNRYLIIRTKFEQFLLETSTI